MYLMSDDRRRDALRLAAETRCDPRTAEKWLTGEEVQGSAGYALERAARDLKIKRRKPKKIPAA